MEITGINHVAFVSKDNDKTIGFFNKVLGLNILSKELVEEQATNTVIFPSFSDSTSDANHQLLELLENQDGKEGPISKYLEKKGPGIHHLALTVVNIEEAVAHLNQHGYEIVGGKIGKGVCDTRIAFVHPKDTGGILLELVEPTKRGNK